MLLRVEMILTGLAAVTPAMLRDSIRVAIGKAGEVWHKRFLPLHFTNAAYARYSAPFRQPGYEVAKRRRRENGQGVRAIGEVKPNVWSGRSREQATGQRDVRAKAASHRNCYAEVVLHAPALNFKNPHTNVHPAAEIRYINEPERNVLQATFQLETARELGRRGHTRKVVRVYKSAA